MNETLRWHTAHIYFNELPKLHVKKKTSQFPQVAEFSCRTKLVYNRTACERICIYRDWQLYTIAS